MDIRIGVTDSPREIALELAEDLDRAALKEQVTAALAGDTPALWLTDAKGKEVAVSSARLAYVELAAEGNNPIGFG